MSFEPLFDKITIIGLGLIGSSIARAVHDRNLANHIVGCDHNEISLAYGRKHGFIDSAASDPATAVSGCELIILATPPSSLSDIAAAIAPHLKQGAIVMDVASVKQPAIDAIAPHMPEGVYFMPAHPIAGSEQSGISAGRTDLFERKSVIITPDEPSNSHQLQQITAFWRSLGARVEAMPAHMHDLVYAYVSHLPQLLAFAAAPCVKADDGEDDPTLHKFLRLSHSSPALWLELFLLNRDNLLMVLERYIDVILHIEHELAQAPDEKPDEADEILARTQLFPRIAASCMITTLMEAEKKAGLSFARYAGTGFADFTFPASQPPEDDIERISGQYQAVQIVLTDYIQRLTAFHDALEEANPQTLTKEMTAI